MSLSVSQKHTEQQCAHIGKKLHKLHLLTVDEVWQQDLLDI